MKIDVKKVAQLARIQISEDKVQEFEAQFDRILKSFAQLQTIETQGISPLVTPHETDQNLRDDQRDESSDFSQKMLEQAPATRGRLFEVPSVIKGES